jgi:DNA-binding response OmpR family regulator
VTICANPARAQHLTANLQPVGVQGGQNRLAGALNSMGTAPQTPSVVLVVEDHDTTRTFLADNLSADGYEVLEADTLRTARRLLERHAPDLMLLDLELPDGDGLDLLGEVRDADLHSRLDAELPAIVLSGRSHELQRIRGFTRGADDYVCKPFSYPELCGRMRALLRRSRIRRRGARVRVGPLEIDPIAREVWVDSATVDLSAKEFALLRILASDPTRVFTREELLRVVWGFRGPVRTRTLDSHASRVRRKLTAAGAPLVVTVWGIGYRLIDPAAVEP